jgi:hypothetical protein
MIKRTKTIIDIFCRRWYIQVKRGYGMKKCKEIVLFSTIIASLLSSSANSAERLVVGELFTNFS